MKVSVSIPDEDLAYVESKVAEGRFANRSAVIHAAIKSLRSRELEDQYAAAFDEWNASGDAADWDTTAGDGIT